MMAILCHSWSYAGKNDCHREQENNTAAEIQWTQS